MSQNNKNEVTFDFVVWQLQLLKQNMIAEHGYIARIVTLEQGKISKWLKLSLKKASANQTI